MLLLTKPPFQSFSRIFQIYMYREKTFLNLTVRIEMIMNQAEQNNLTRQILRASIFLAGKNNLVSVRFYKEFLLNMGREILFTCSPPPSN